MRSRTRPETFPYPVATMLTVRTVLKCRCHAQNASPGRGSIADRLGREAPLSRRRLPLPAYGVQSHRRYREPWWPPPELAQATSSVKGAKAAYVRFVIAALRTVSTATSLAELPGQSKQGRALSRRQKYGAHMSPTDAGALRQPRNPGRLGPSQGQTLTLTTRNGSSPSLLQRFFLHGLAKTRW